MQTYIEFEINGMGYSIDESHEGHMWANDAGDEGTRFHATQADAQQDAILWEAGRRERYEGSEEEAIDARNRYMNQRCDDARGA